MHKLLHIKKSKAAIGGFLLLFLLFCLAIVSLLQGSLPMQSGDLWAYFFNPSELSDPLLAQVIEKIRLPRLVAGILAGGALAVAGLLMQTLFENPLAGPSVLGVTSGASLGVAAVVMAGASGFGASMLGQSSLWLVGAAILGAMLTTLLVLLFAVRIRNTVSLLIIGMMLSSMVAALVGLWQYLADPAALKAYIVWTFGSLTGLNQSMLPWFLGAVVFGLAVSMVQVRALDGLLLGQTYAQTMGISVRKVRIWLIVASAFLAGSTTAFCGPIAFVGLVCPHIARYMLQTALHRVLLPVSFLVGANLLVLCDLLSRSFSEQYALPVNITSSLIGAPLVILLLLSRKER